MSQGRVRNALPFLALLLVTILSGCITILGKGIQQDLNAIIDHDGLKLEQNLVVTLPEEFRNNPNVIISDVSNLELRYAPSKFKYESRQREWLFPKSEVEGIKLKAEVRLKAVPKQPQLLKTAKVEDSTKTAKPKAVASVIEVKTKTPQPTKSVAPPSMLVAKVAPTKPSVATKTKALVIPANAVAVLPLLIKTTDLVWPQIPYRSFLAAQIEQESCVSLTSPKCWNTRSELKTKREYGFGYGQTTIAYKADGTERFNVWQELRNLDPDLKHKWTWENRFDPEMQMRALLIKNRINFNSIRFTTANVTEHMAFTAATYNGGSTIMDRNICLRTAGCDPSRWFNTTTAKGVEAYSNKSKLAQVGYGKSFFEISREYPKQLLFVRREKYIPYVDIKVN